MKKMLSIVLTVAMLFSLLLAGASAEEVTEINIWSIYIDGAGELVHLCPYHPAYA